MTDFGWEYPPGVSGPPEPDLCKECGGNIDEDGKCEDCENVICCYGERCYCTHPDV